MVKHLFLKSFVFYLREKDVSDLIVFTYRWMCDCGEKEHLNCWHLGRGRNVRLACRWRLLSISLHTIHLAIWSHRWYLLHESILLGLSPWQSLPTRCQWRSHVHRKATRHIRHYQPNFPCQFSVGHEYRVNLRLQPINDSVGPGEGSYYDSARSNCYSLLRSSSFSSQLSKKKRIYKSTDRAKDLGTFNDASTIQSSSLLRYLQWIHLVFRRSPLEYFRLLDCPLSGVSITKAINAPNVSWSPIGNVFNAFHFDVRSLLQYVPLATLRVSIPLI